jgi:hypothetical protein
MKRVKFMVIQCTRKLLDELKINPAEASEEPLFCWHANLLNINRRKTIVLMNDSSRYIIVIHGFKANDKKIIGYIIKHAIEETLLAEGIKEEAAQRYIQYAPEVVFSKTKDRSKVGKLNQACETVCFYSEYLKTDSLIQIDASIRISTYPAFHKGNLTYPNEEMYKDLEKLLGQPIFQQKAAILKVTLNLKNNRVWRRLIMPYDITFEKLHLIIQTAFNWQNWHLHDFNVYDKKGPAVNIVQSEDDFEFPSELPRVLETDLKIGEYIPKHKRLLYRYDFGDNWEHRIEVEDLEFGYNKSYSVCLDGEGNTPPEDVGAEHGYKEFLNIISNPGHAEYKETKRWANMQRYKEFNIDNVNYSLKRLTPDIVIQKDQAWFDTKQWQKEEQQVSKEIAEDKLNVAKNKKDLFDDLGLDE